MNQISVLLDRGEDTGGLYGVEMIDLVGPGLMAPSFESAVRQNFLFGRTVMVAQHVPSFRYPRRHRSGISSTPMPCICR